MTDERADRVAAWITRLADERDRLQRERDEGEALRLAMGETVGRLSDERDRYQRELRATQREHAEIMRLATAALDSAHAQRDAALALAGRLREALRKYSIIYYSGVSRVQCGVCGGKWTGVPREPERHAPACLAAEEPRTDAAQGAVQEPRG